MTENKNQPAKILVVDDNQQNLELLIAYLEDMDIECDIDSAIDGQEALDKIKECCPDIVLLDVMMPHISGFEVCRRIKNNPETAHLPVIMVTALTEFGDIEKAISYGADDFISKPVNKLELLTRVKTMLKLKHLTDKLEKTLAYLSEIESQVRP